MSKKFPLNPTHPERNCWGCDHYCATDAMRCGNGSSRTQHPAELMGADWYEFGDWDLDVAEGARSVSPSVNGKGHAAVNADSARDNSDSFEPILKRAD